MTPYEWFAESARSFAALVSQVRPEQWAGPGLGVWDLRALVGHGARALVTVDTYLDRPASEVVLDDAADYFRATSSGATDAAAVAERGRQAGEALGPDPVAGVHALVERVLPRVAQAGDPLITTIGGGTRLSTYLPTRTFELVVHALDVSRAAGLPAPRRSEALLGEVVALAAAVAVRQGHGADVLLALTGRAPLPAGFSVV